MISKVVLLFFTFKLLAFAQETKSVDKDSVESGKLKRGLAELNNYGFNSLSAYPGIAPFSFDTKETFPYFISENKIPIPLNPAFRIPDSEIYLFEVNESPFLKAEPLNFPQSLILKPDPILSQTYEPLKLPQFYQHLNFPQKYQSTSKQYFKPDVKDIRPIFEEMQE